MEVGCEGRYTACFLEVRIPKDLHVGSRGTAHSKGLVSRRFRLKTGKTRCLSRTADSKELRAKLGDGGWEIGLRERKRQAVGEEAMRYTQNSYSAK
jgi:hypothetical protein